MLFLVTLASAVIITLLLWKAMNTERNSSRPGLRHALWRPSGGAVRSRVSGPDDDPDFLRHLDETVRRREDPPTT
ncbi:hypothetical protein [Pseudonocardia asaccharolytica]|uniref:Uncharacterized protein n=1 Tax=Pseudonocardia asaccharolytica DSM 44247 = NBRC 16224 TaxID=1123024 RepID=A0A511CV04_9PSEU|nr:hypothetical protein [Pseudonocardia asaccharolytica]GEL16381.1 hypothetical protein PA7_02180 [Pseudonocardia asaccharolytica DSM 44247 = NBRC 16224]